MPLPASFQLSLDLSNIIGPIAKGALRLASMTVFHEINKSGSDGITELQLSALIGRHRIAQCMKENFQNIVAQSHQSIISHVLQAERLILEVGAGPSVRQAITNPNPALLSMVIQISLLGFAHEQQSLAQAITTVSGEMLRESLISNSQDLDYVSILGVITACQQQTAKFPWIGFFERTEQKIRQTVTNGRPGKSYLKKRRLNNSAREKALSSILDRSLPFVILKALFIHLVSVQDFPEHRNLQLRTNSGASTIVVWCYYVLGLSVNVRVGCANVNFGDDPQIFVEHCGHLQAFASVLDATRENEPCFKLTQVEEDPPIQRENRTTTRGFARKVMTLSGSSEATIDRQARQIAVDCIRLLPSTSQLSNLTSLKLVSMSSQIREQICKSTALLFDIPELETTSTAELSNEIEQQETMTRPRSNAKWAQLLLVIISFARVRDLSMCENLPLSLDAFWELSNEEFALSVKGNQFTGTAPNTFVSFDIISHLLLGHQYSKEDVESSALVSSWGWSIFLDAFDALDPAHVRPGLIHIQLGVPSRNGERKTRVVDGPADIPIEYGTSLDYDGIPIVFWPGVSDSQLSATLIGYSGRDAFSVVQVYEWNMNGRKSKKWRLGFRGKQEMCLKFTVIDQCPCATSLRDDESENWIDTYAKFIANGQAGCQAALGTATCGEIYGITRKYPSDSGELSLFRERVFCCDLGVRDQTHSSSNAWFFFVTSNPVSRWLAIDGLDQLKGEDGGFQHILRGKNCCVRCACEAITTKSLVLL